MEEVMVESEERRGGWEDWRKVGGRGGREGGREEGKEWECEREGELEGIRKGDRGRGG